MVWANGLAVPSFFSGSEEIALLPPHSRVTGSETGSALLLTLLLIASMQQCLGRVRYEMACRQHQSLE